MEIWGYLLYPIMAIILIWMWRRVRGSNIEEIVDKSAREHHKVNDVFVEHPLGGSWSQFQNWMNEHRH